MQPRQPQRPPKALRRDQNKVEQVGASCRSSARVFGRYIGACSSIKSCRASSGKLQRSALASPPRRHVHRVSGGRAISCPTFPATGSFARRLSKGTREGASPHPTTRIALAPDESSIQNSTIFPFRSPLNPTGLPGISPVSPQGFRLCASASLQGAQASTGTGSSRNARKKKARKLRGIGSRLRGLAGLL